MAGRRRDGWVPAAQAAAEVRVSEIYLRARTAQGTVPFRKRRGHTEYKVSSLRQHLDAETAAARSALRELVLLQDWCNQSGEDFHRWLGIFQIHRATLVVGASVFVDRLYADALRRRDSEKSPHG